MTLYLRLLEIIQNPQISSCLEEIKISIIDNW